MKLKSNLAFTLIELLVVIVIVGILSGFIIVSLNNAINTSKDAKAKSDISALERALLMYFVQSGNTYPNNDTYPCTIGGGTTPCTNLALDLQIYLPSLPTNPNGGYYTYSYSNSPEPNFTITATLSDASAYEYNSITGFNAINYSSTCTAATNSEVQCIPITINSTEEVCRCIFLSGSGETIWTVPNGVNQVQYLVVAGGGGGGGYVGGGGGAGGFRTGTMNVSGDINLKVGSGGGQNTNGNNSIFGTITSTGGGFGGSYNNISPNPGGSGGGGVYNARNGAASLPVTDPVQGYAGGNPSGVSSAGGGGAGGLGGNGKGSGGYNYTAGDGGIGRQSDITGVSLYYAGGGGAGGYNSYPNGTGGQGGGGNGGGGNGTNGLGGGGGGSYYNTGGGSGGSGVVIIRYQHP